MLLHEVPKVSKSTLYLHPPEKDYVVIILKNNILEGYKIDKRNKKLKPKAINELLHRKCSYDFICFQILNYYELQSLKFI